jgi:hypothetical protein
VSALSSVAPPIVLSGPEYDSLHLPTNTPLGCFIRGAGIYFNDLESDGLEYTLRLRHEVGEDKSWETRDAAPNFQAPGPRITDKSVHYMHCKSMSDRFVRGSQSTLLTLGMHWCACEAWSWASLVVLLPRSAPAC